jgi:hypothetical protein
LRLYNVNDVGRAVPPIESSNAHVVGVAIDADATLVQQFYPIVSSFNGQPDVFAVTNNNYHQLSTFIVKQACADISTM